jgi:hypothetical protein
MRDPQRFPRYVIVGHTQDQVLSGAQHRVLYQVHRASDMAACAAELGTVTDDGVLVSRPSVRQWHDADQAASCIARLEEGRDKDSLGFTDVWLQDIAWNLMQPDLFGMHIDMPLV